MDEDSHSDLMSTSSEHYTSAHDLTPSSQSPIESSLSSLDLPLSHLNPFGLVIRTTRDKGRGVYSTRRVPTGATIDISPVLLFGKAEYELHAKHTAVDDYAFVWGDGQMALALGLGSIMNHSDTPNVSYVRDKTNLTMSFITMKDIREGEELCIYYGAKLWFQSAERAVVKMDVPEPPILKIEAPEESGDLATWTYIPPERDVSPHGSDGSSSTPSAPSQRPRRSRKKRANDRLTQSTGSTISQSATSSKTSLTTPSLMIPSEDLPFERFKFPDEELLETDDGPIPMTQIWAVNILDTKKIGLILDHIRSNAEQYEADSLKQLKRIRRTRDPLTNETTTALAVAPYHPNTPSPPPFPADLERFLLEPFVATVPATPATTNVQLERKSKVWPVGYFPIMDVTKKEKEWTKEEVEWVRNGLQQVVREARRCKSEGELPIAAFVAPTSEPPKAESCDEDGPALSTTKLQRPRPQWTHHDTRQSLHHPLRHVCLNIIRKVAEDQSAMIDASRESGSSPAPHSSSSNTRLIPTLDTPIDPQLDTSSTSPSPTPSLDEAPPPTYLLTSYSLFVTHEPCIMCSMALLHSRVKNVFYIVPMPQTGGCGGLVKESVPGLKGVNHRYGIWRWREDVRELGIDDEGLLDIPETTDV